MSFFSLYTFSYLQTDRLHLLLFHFKLINDQVLNIRNSSPGVNNEVNALTCKSLPVPQQCVIKPFNYTLLYIAGLRAC